MITKAFIVKKLPTNKYLVRIPYLEDTTGSNSLHVASILEATAVMNPGTLNVYKEGDCVFVAFENIEQDKPVILGLLYKGNEYKELARAHQYNDSLTVTNKAKLPINTTIGKITYQDLITAINSSGVGEFAPIIHNHSISEVTGLQAALDNKAASNHNHDSSYADISHNHDSSYADISHNHDSSYADISHNHDTSYADISHNHSISEVTGLQAELDSKASALTEVQINAVNSGITSQKVSTYDGYSTSKQNKLSAGQQDAVDSGITATKVSQYDSYSSSKQDKLSAVQQSAVDSGIDSTKVSKYDGYETSKQNKLTEAQVNAVNSGITGSKVSQYDGYDSGKQDKLTTVQQNAINSGITSDKVAIYEAMVSSSHIHNNLSLLETYTQTEANLSDAVSKKHSHSNKTVLDNLTQGVINNNHTHSNKTLLETYTQTEANLSDAVSKKHSHSNKAVLDNLTQGVIDNNHIHLNKTLLDSYTQTNTDISDAVTKKHIHTNKSVLDNLTQNVIDKAHGHSSTEQIAINTISGLQGALNNKQPTLVGSGTGQNIKTIGGQNIMGSGNIPFPTSTSGTWELIRTRGPSDNLTNAGSGNTSIDIPVTTTLSEGDTIAIEVSNTSSYQQHPKIIITTLSWVDEPIDLTISDQVGFIYYLAGNLQICSFAVTKNSTGNALITKRKQYISGSFSGTTINWATGDYTLHIGRVWRLVQ